MFILIFANIAVTFTTLCATKDNPLNVNKVSRHSNKTRSLLQIVGEASCVHSNPVIHSKLGLKFRKKARKSSQGYIIVFLARENTRQVL